MAEPLLIQARYRNKLEKSVGEQLTSAGVSFKYEPHTLPITIPARQSTYLPDFKADNAPIIIESKGYFYNGSTDRKKLLLVKEQHPELDIRIVFSNASKKIYKNSPTTYGAWATANGFVWADGGKVPEAWLKEMKGTKLEKRKV
jgi:hypothetical protein